MRRNKQVDVDWKLVIGGRPKHVGIRHRLPMIELTKAMSSKRKCKLNHQAYNFNPPSPTHIKKKEQWRDSSEIPYPRIDVNREPDAEKSKNGNRFKML